MRKWILRGGVVLLCGMLVVALLWLFSGLGHDPNHGINREQARAAASRVHATPPPGFQMGPDKGG